jgi:type I restriction enzyme S subunit
MKRYDCYKNSDVDWIGEIPENWKIGALKHCFKFNVGFTPPTSNEKYYIEVDSNEGHDWVTIGDLKSKYIFDSKHKISDLAAESYNKDIIPKGSLLYSFKLSVGKVAFAGKDIYTNEAIFSILPDENLELSFYYYCLPTILIHNANENIYGAKIFNQEVIKNSKLPIPSLEEQTQIAAFLDYKTNLIDATIEKKKRLIELLKEKRQAVINEAVTKGLNPNAPMKDSGVEWLGEIPEHWDKLKIGRTFNLIGSGTTPNTNTDKFYNDGNINWLNTGDLNDSYIFETKKKITVIALKETSLKIFPEDCIVIALYGATIGKLGHLKIATTTNQACCVLSNSKSVINRFLFYYFLSSREHIISMAYGGGQPNISQELIKQLYIPTPSLEEQSLIVSTLDELTLKIDESINKIEIAISKLETYRQSLISEAVTGKIDVREWQINNK